MTTHTGQVADRWRRPILAILVIFLVCAALRTVEYFAIRTDETIVGEAILHKLAGIGILAAALAYFSLTWSQIGFSRRTPIRFVLAGLLLGVGVFVVAYGAEYLLLSMQGAAPSFEFYVSSYTIDGNRGRQTALVFFAISIVGNLVNVLMEEGLFRGLFQKLGEARFGFLGAAILSSVLFGLWHIAAPVRALVDGDQSPAGAGMSALLLVGTSTLVGFKFALLVRITGSLWMPMADHFVNNTVVNLVHVTTATGADELQVVRISIAQSLSFVIVLAIYFATKAYRKPTFRPASASRTRATA